MSQPYSSLTPSVEIQTSPCSTEPQRHKIGLKAGATWPTTKQRKVVLMTIKRKEIVLSMFIVLSLQDRRLICHSS